MILKVVFNKPRLGTLIGVALALLVAAPVAAQEPTDEAAAPAALRGGSETVLIAEDDDGMRQVAIRFLQSLGYNTLEAARPDEARRIEAGHVGPIHLLLTDVVMPEMGGRGLADLLTSRRPGMQVLFMSGYTDDAVAEHGIVPEQTFFLSKPFSREALGRKVREVLDSANR